MVIRLLLAAMLGVTTLTAAAVPAATSAPAPQALHPLWTRSLSPNADSAPSYAAGVSVSGKKLAAVYLLAGNNTSNCNPGSPVTRATLYALNAANGRTLWTQSTSGPSRCTTAGPVVDPSGKWVYAPGLDGKLHRYNAATGGESGGAWPVAFTLIPDVEKVASTPTIGAGHLYVTTSGFIGDQGHYEGHLVTIDLATGRSRVFNSLCSSITQLLTASACSSVQSGLFGRGQGVTDPVNHDVYVVSGNGPWNGRTNWGDSILKLDPTGARLLDAFTPTNQAELASSDQDLGSTGPALLPTVKRAGRSYHLLVQGGKGPACSSCSGVALRLLNRDNLSGAGGPGHLGGDLQDLSTPCNSEILTAPAVWTSPEKRIWVFYANDCAVAGYRLSATAAGFRLSQMWLSRPGATTPVLSRDVLWIARQDGHLEGLDPKNGQVLYSGAIGSVHWEYPLAAGKRVFVADESGKVSAFGVGGGARAGRP